jgi:flagellar basal-body rod modification protein FlgD
MSVAPISHDSPAQTGNTQSATDGSSSSDSSLQSIESTFLSLLVQELQNQDPTAPMDSTAMVGQMISLNQLDQLASINQTVTDAFGQGTPAATGANAASVVASTN